MSGWRIRARGTRAVARRCDVAWREERGGD